MAKNQEGLFWFSQTEADSAWDLLPIAVIRGEEVEYTKYVPNGHRAPPWLSRKIYWAQKWPDEGLTVTDLL
jgi:hypothetical protein